jgi:hypothetical protein
MLIFYNPNTYIHTFEFSFEQCIYINLGEGEAGIVHYAWTPCGPWKWALKWIVKEPTDKA